MPAVVVLSTFPDEARAADIARVLVEARLAACVNLVASARSIYRWQGAIEEAREVLAVIKTTSERLEALRARLVELHPYELPEVIALPIIGGHAGYLDWIASETSAT
jgi:periplasmic divalent cation tolerance protein